MTDEEIVNLYWDRSPDAISETDLKYGGLCHKISGTILRDKRDVEECVSDSYWTVWNKIPPHRPAFFSAFLSKIVRVLSLKKYEYNTAEKRNTQFDISIDELSECFRTGKDVEEICDANILAKTIDVFLELLSEEKRVVFVKRYFFAETLEEIAKETGHSTNNTSVILHRVRKQLKEYLEKEEIYI